MLEPYHDGTCRVYSVTTKADGSFYVGEPFWHWTAMVLDGHLLTICPSLRIQPSTLLTLRSDKKTCKQSASAALLSRYGMLSVPNCDVLNQLFSLPYSIIWLLRVPPSLSSLTPTSKPMVLPLGKVAFNVAHGTLTISV